MAVTLTGAGGLFTRLGKLFFAMQTINTARLTTVPDEITDYTDEFDNVTTDILRTIEQIPDAETRIKAAWDGPMETLRESARRVLIRMINNDNPQADESTDTALIELIRQMVDNSDTVDASAAGISVSAGGSNVGDGTWVTSVKRADGLAQENILGEDIYAEVTGGAAGSETIALVGEAAVQNKLSQDWPSGSGVSSSTTVVNPEIKSTSGNLLANGGFEDEDDLANSPDDWETPVATIGTTLALTNPEVQTLTIASDPTSGSYTLSWSNAGSQVQTTGRIAWNATSGVVQTALRTLKGLEKVTVTLASGTSPNFTHTITFIGVPGNVSQLTATSNLDTGTVTPGTTSGGGIAFQGGKSLDIIGNGSQLTAIQQNVTLQPLTQYAFSSQWLASGSVAAGAVKYGLWDGADWIDDEQGVENSGAIDLTATGTSTWDNETAVFRTPKNLPDIVYLRIALTTAITNTEHAYVDDVALAPMNLLYPGGPSVRVFRGLTPFVAGDDQQQADNWTVTPTNDRAGEFQEWFERVFEMRSLGLLLPSLTDTNETIDDDTLIA